MATKNKRKTIPIRVGGMDPAGDAALIQAGATRNQRNTLPYPGQIWIARPPFVAESLTSPNVDYVLWEDATTNKRRFAAIHAQVALTPLSLYIKSASAETYASAVTASAVFGVFRVCDYANFRGRLILAVQNESTTLALIPQIYNGAASIDPLFVTGPAPVSVVTFIDRLVMLGGNLSFTNEIGATNAYDPTVWTATAVTATLVTSGSNIVGRIRPSNATTASILSPPTGAFTSTETNGQFSYLGWFRGVSASYSMPITVQVVINYSWAIGTVYGTNAVIVPTTANLNGFRYRATVGGTSHAATEPTWPVAPGSTVTDNTITWINDGPSVIGSRELNVPPVSEFPEGQVVAIQAALQKPHGNTKVSVKIVFGNTATTSVSTDESIDISVRDGLTDGTLGKANHGQQITRGAFSFPFFNQESSAATVVEIGDKIYLSEPGDIANVTGQAFYVLRDTADDLTAGFVHRKNRLCAFKRVSVTTYVPNEADPDNPLIREGGSDGAGALHAKAIDACDNIVYGIGENFVWAWQPGSEFEDICGDGMRDLVMDKSSATWVESQATYNVPILTIDQARKIVYVYTQKGRIFGYRIPTKDWFIVDVNAYGFEVRDMLWHQGTGKLYVSWGGQQGARLDHAVSNQSDAVNNSGTTYPVVSQTDVPVEFRGPQYDVILDRVNAYIKATADQTGQVFYVYVSEDQGQTFTLYNEITLPTGYNYQRVPIDLYQLNPAFIVRLEKHGNGGGENYTLSSAEAEINVMAGAFPTVSPSGVGSNLT